MSCYMHLLVCLITVLPDCTSFILGYILKFRRPVIQSDLYFYFSHYFLLFMLWLSIVPRCAIMCLYCSFTLGNAMYDGAATYKQILQYTPPYFTFWEGQRIHCTPSQISLWYHRYRITLPLLVTMWQHDLNAGWRIGISAGDLKSLIKSCSGIYYKPC